MRADRELIEADVFARGLDAALEIIDGLELRHFGADQAEHHNLVLGHKAQRLEPAGARQIIFQQETVMRQLIEQTLGNRVVSALAVPHAALVAATQMNAERHAIETADQRGLGRDRTRQICLRVLAPRPHRLQGWTIRISRKARRIDVDVSTPRLDRAGNHLALDVNHVVDERLHIGVDRLRSLMIEALGDAIRPDQAHLDGLLRQRAGTLVFRKHDVVGELEPVHHRTTARHRSAALLQIRHVEALHRRRTGGALHVQPQGVGRGVVARNRQPETVLEIEPADLTIGDNIKADALLQFDQLAHALDFDLGEGLRGKLALVELLPRLLPALWPQ